LIPMDGMIAVGVEQLPEWSLSTVTISVRPATDQSGIAATVRQAPITMTPPIKRRTRLSAMLL
jgi:hypothetical protein